MDHPLPDDQTELCLVATDDTVFVHRDRQGGQCTLDKFDAAMAAASIPRKVSKDISLSETITALGCEITSRPHMAEPIVYEFARRAPQSKPQKLPATVKQELAVVFGLLPLLSVGLDKPCYEELLACDAAPEFGFGVSAAACNESTLLSVSRLAERRGDYVRLHQVPGEETEQTRIGTPHRLKVSKKAFRTVVSARAGYKAHSGVLEAHGLLLTLKWLTRSRRKHHKKVVILVDAKAVLGAAAKGRTSSPSLRGVIRAVAAHSLASDLLVKLIYIPSESNPADAPSRGKGPGFDAGPLREDGSAPRPHGRACRDVGWSLDRNSPAASRPRVLSKAPSGFSDGNSVCVFAMKGKFLSDSSETLEQMG
eukprot:s3085_g14.t1